MCARRLSSVLALLLAAVLAPGGSAAARPPSAPPGASGAGPAAGASALQGLAAGKTPQKGAAAALRMSTAVQRVVEARAARGARAALVEADARGMRVEGDAARVAVRAREGMREQAFAAVVAVGGRTPSVLQDVIIATIPIDRLVTLSQSPAVAVVFDPPRPHVEDVGSSVSEGRSELGVPGWAVANAEHGAITGAGIKVGVLDLGFKGYRSLLGSELPPESMVHTWVAGPEFDDEFDGPAALEHGAGVAEIIHDVAPDAELYLAYVDDPGQIAQAVGWMVRNGVKVINMSMSWYGWSRIDGSGPVNAVFDSAIASGTVCVVSAGNYRQHHWSGDFVGGSEPWPYMHLHNFGPSDEENEFYIGKVPRYVEAWLWWDDWSSSPAEMQDYNFQLVRWNGTEWVEVYQSRDLQSVTGVPAESIKITLTQTGWYAWRIWRASATRTDVNFDMFVLEGPRLVPVSGSATFGTTQRSVLQPTDNRSAGVIAVAAINRGPGFPQEEYSSEGPTIDGRTGVDVSAPSSVTCVSYGTQGFNGTSASAPHVAGLAALVLQAQPGLTPAEVERFLLSQTVDLGAPGTDTLFGAGRISLGALPEFTATVSPAITKYGSAATVTGSLVASGSAVPSRTVELQRSYDGGKTWSRVATATWSPTARTYRATATMTRNAHFRLYHAGDATVAPRYTSALPAKAYAYLSAAKPTSTPYKGRSVRVQGTMKPSHVGTTRIYLYRYNATKRTYVQYGYVAAKVATGGSAATYYASVKFPYAGKWRTRAWHSDATHATTWGPTYDVTVR